MADRLKVADYVAIYFEQATASGSSFSPADANRFAIEQSMIDNRAERASAGVVDSVTRHAREKEARRGAKSWLQKNEQRRSAMIRQAIAASDDLAAAVAVADSVQIATVLEAFARGDDVDPELIRLVADRLARELNAAALQKASSAAVTKRKQERAGEQRGFSISTATRTECHFIALFNVYLSTDLQGASPPGAVKAWVKWLDKRELKGWEGRDRKPITPRALGDMLLKVFGDPAMALAPAQVDELNRRERQHP